MRVKLVDSRRWPGPSLLLDAPGVVIDVSIRGDTPSFVEAWRAAVEDLHRAVDWPLGQVGTRVFSGGVTLAFTAPIDALYAATELNELAFARASHASPGDDAVDALRATIRNERNPALLALRDAANTYGVTFLSDDDHASVGLGAGCRTWPVDDLPAPDAVDWASVSDIPVAMVTGTNGKSTTVRLLAHIAKCADLVPGVSSTDWIRVGEDKLDTGDYSGPGGARTVLRDRRTQVAFLETARGGLLRRGLGFWRADAAAVLNVAEDHLGEWGVGDLAALVEAKFILAKAVGPNGTLLLNHDDEPVRVRGQRERTPRWFGLHPPEDAPAFDACVRNGRLVAHHDGAWQDVVGETEIPITVGARARFNTSNALAATALALRTGIPLSRVREGLTTFESSPEANPGRMNHFAIGGATVFADFAHNPHGFRALFDMAASFEDGRTLVLLGQAGDRTDDDVRALVRATWDARPDHVIVKDMPQHLRGRAPGEMVALIDNELARAGVPADRITHAATELDAVRQALAWSRPGDLLLLLLHAQRGESLAYLATCRGTRSSAAHQRPR